MKSSLTSNTQRKSPKGKGAHINWYLPHFAVQNQHKPDKMRIAQVKGVSLNSMLKGRKHAKSLLNILF